MPRGLLSLLDIVECGYLEETRFMWVKQNKKVEHCFDKVGRMVSYAAEITTYVEEFRIRKLTGVKVKELMLWLTLSEISVDSSVSSLAGKLTYNTSPPASSASSPLPPSSSPATLPTSPGTLSSLLRLCWQTSNISNRIRRSSRSWRPD
ncbi:hypothetical protein Taro_023001 [Colocasia esculenta]|uniref:Uncharacterized protein n=1 Tax=Colocasia esculenta TaxID=4460 RepID=A0A843VA12_COLES|nr:hypothetical protein [Colocasia esculenta]